MKQKFVNATLADRRKGSELAAQIPDTHPLRPTPLKTTPMEGLPVIRAARPAPKAPEPTEEEKIRAEVARLLAAAPKKAKPVPKSKIFGMMSPSQETPEAQKYQDILEMLMAKK